MNVLGRDEVEARDAAWLETPGMNAEQGRYFNEGWEAARKFYAASTNTQGAVSLLREARFYVDARATGSVKAAELLARIDAALPPDGGQ